MPHPDKTSLSVRLTEPVVSLRSTLENSPRQDGPRETLPPAIVRGLLTLRLAKPTKVSRIVLELQAKATTHYVRGAAPARTDVTEQYRVHSASALVFDAGTFPQERLRVTSALPRAQFLDVHTTAGAHSDPRPVARSASLDPRPLRQLSSDGLEIDDGRFSQHPAPPYHDDDRRRTSHLSVDCRPFAVGRSHSVASSSGTPGPQGKPLLPLFRVLSAPILGHDRRNGDNLVLKPSFQGSPVLFRGSPSSPDVPRSSPTSSEPSIFDFPLSRTSSIEELPEGDGDVNVVDASTLHPDNVGYYGLSRIATGGTTPARGSFSEQDPPHPHYRRGRSRFSLASIVQVVDAVKDRVRSRSPRPGSAEREERGRSPAKGKGKVQGGATLGVAPPSSAARPTVSDGADGQSGDGWVVFPEGTYIYPILFTIPNNSPPTIKAEHGSLAWKVKAEVKRPGVFKSKMTAQQEVVVVRLLKDGDSEEAGGVDLEKQWEDQLQYRVRITGQGFPIGGKVPFQLTIMPLAKIKVHCISASLDERTEYYTRSQIQVRAGLIRRSTLLAIGHNSLLDRYSEPILPLMSADPDAFHKSPLYQVLNPGEDESEVTASFMGPGPWTIRHELSLPDSCSALHPSNQMKGSNVTVGHTLKMTMRVEKEEAAGMAGKKKLYDIVIHIPIHILSCHCTREWTSLPCYDEALRGEHDSAGDASTCPCRARTRAKARRRSHASDTPAVPLERTASLQTASSSSSSALGAFSSNSLATRTQLHEQLMSGLVSERGEAPPSYEVFEAGS